VASRRAPAPRTKEPEARAEAKAKEAEDTSADDEPTAKATPREAPKTNPTAKSKAEGSITVSEPLTVGTQIVVTARDLEPSVKAKAEIEAPGGSSTQSNLKTDPNGTVQVFFHGPQAGDYSVEITAGESSASTEFEVK
jgi:hypothetical protein